MILRILTITEMCISFLMATSLLAGCSGSIPCNWESGHTIQRVLKCDIAFCYVEAESEEYGYAWFPRTHNTQNVCILRNHVQASDGGATNE